MIERPILFNEAMVRAILNGSKTQTRRIVKLPVIDKSFGCELGGCELNAELEAGHLISPYGQVGDQLWVRETFAEAQKDDFDVESIRPDGRVFLYKATACIHTFPVGEYLCADGVVRSARAKKWTPSIHMPRIASRITLEITSIRVERLNDCSESDAMAEGCIHNACGPDYKLSKKWAYRELWESINGAGSWDANPWVWVVEFKVVKP